MKEVKFIILLKEAGFQKVSGPYLFSQRIQRLERVHYSFRTTKEYKKLSHSFISTEKRYKRKWFILSCKNSIYTPIRELLPTNVGSGDGKEFGSGYMYMYD